MELLLLAIEMITMKAAIDLLIVDDTAKEEKNKKAKDTNPAATQGEPQSAKLLVESQEEQPADLNVMNKESAPPASDAKLNERKELPLSKIFKIMTPIPDIPNTTPLNTFIPEHLLKSKEKQKSIQEFTDQLFKTTSSRFSPTPPKELAPLRDSSKGKAIAIIEEPWNELVKYQEEGGSYLKIPKLKSFITLEGPLFQEEYNNQIREIKRLNDMKAEQEKLEEEFRKADTLPITKISYVVNSIKEETMKITRGENPQNLIVHPNFRLQTLGFSEWLEVHALASKKSGTSNNLLLQSLRAKFQWVINQAKRLGLSSPPELATFGLTVEAKEMKRTDLIKEVFVTENVWVNGMDMNLIPSLGIMPIQGLVINEPES
nr:hypothetical protein [Tanacetum cinerariifolium]